MGTVNDTVEALPGLAPWFGGKRNLAKRLVERIEAIPHRLYCEPFVGMGASSCAGAGGRRWRSSKTMAATW